jgi:hypothetical protein
LLNLSLQEEQMETKLHVQQTVQTSSKKWTSNNQFTSLFLEVAFYMYVHNFFALAQHFHILKTISPPPNKQPSDLMPLSQLMLPNWSSSIIVCKHINIRIKKNDPTRKRKVKNENSNYM